MDSTLSTIIEKVSNTRGEAFFNSITLALHDAIGADFTFVARLDRENYSSHTLALVADGNLVDNISYSLANTPCANAADDSVCCYRADVTTTFPDDLMLQDMGIEGYLGTPLHNLKGEVMGIIVALYRRPIQDHTWALELFKLFSGRIEAELDRVAHEKKLEQANQSLESKVAERTEHLNRAIADLKQAQDKLIESEKMAAMGSLVAGLAHEVNTPLGVAITSYSVIKEHKDTLVNAYRSGELSTEQLDEFLDVCDNALSLLDVNLHRAVDLVESFKRTAADQHTNDTEHVNLAQYYHQVVTALKPLLKTMQAQVKLEIPTDWDVDTIPGAHSQILTNLLSNSISHGFIQGADNQIHIRGERLADGSYRIHYSDNGRGLSEEARKRIFEPFYTTARSRGGIGLGMSIVFNLVHQQLNGSLDLPDSDKGFAMEFSFKG